MSAKLLMKAIQQKDSEKVSDIIISNQFKLTTKVKYQGKRTTLEQVLSDVKLWSVVYNHMSNNDDKSKIIKKMMQHALEDGIKQDNYDVIKRYWCFIGEENQAQLVGLVWREFLSQAHYQVLNWMYENKYVNDIYLTAFKASIDMKTKAAWKLKVTELQKHGKIEKESMDPLKQRIQEQNQIKEVKKVKHITSDNVPVTSIYFQYIFEEAEEGDTCVWKAQYNSKHKDVGDVCGKEKKDGSIFCCKHHNYMYKYHDHRIIA